MVVQHILYPATFLPAWPDEDGRSRFVFITDGLDPTFITQVLEDFSLVARQGVRPPTSNEIHSSEDSHV